MAYVIGITGGSGSGKSSFVKALQHALPTSQVCVFPQDNYYRDRDAQKMDDQGIQNFDRLGSIDMDAYHADLCLLVAGQAVQRSEYTFNNPLVTPRMLTYAPAPVIIVEGLFVLTDDRIYRMLNLKLFIEASDVKKVIRRLRRDGLERNYPMDDVLYRYEHHVLPSYRRYIEPQRARADLVINNDHDMTAAIHVLVSHIKSMI